MTPSSRFFYGYIIVIVSFFIMMVILGLQSSFGIFIKPITEEMGWTRAITSGAFSVAQIIGGICFILMGTLSDKFGLRLVVILCCILSILGYLLMSLTQSIWQLYLFYGLLIGAGSSIFVPILSAVARWFAQRRSMMTGIVFAGSGFGMIAFPPLINWFISSYNWRLSFVYLSGIILIVSLLAVFLLKSGPEEPAREISNKDNTRLGNRSLSLNEAVHTRQFWLFCIIVMSYGFCFFSIQVHIAPYMTDIGISSTGAADVMAIIGVAGIAGQAGLGSLGDKIGYRNAFLLGLVLIVAALSALILARELWVFFIFAILLGLAFGDCGTQESPITAWLFGLRSHGLIFGFVAFSFTVGAAIGPLVFGYIFDTTRSYQPAFMISITLAILAVVLTLFLKQTGSRVYDKYTEKTTRAS